MVGSSAARLPTTWHQLSALLRGERLVAHNMIVGGGTVVAGMLGVAFQSLVSHRLQPADYGSVFVVVSLITLVGLPASAFTLLMARETSRGRATGQPAPSASLLRNGNRILFAVGLGLGVLLGALSPLLAAFLTVPVSLVLAGATAMPFTLALPLLLGEFQGEQRFLAFSILSAGQAGLKLVAAIITGFYWGPLGIILGVSTASAVTYVVALRMLRTRLRIRPRYPWFRSAASYLAIVIPSALCLAILLSTDVLVVKHYFPIRTAGEYSAVAALGRAVFWGASGVAAVLFPKIISRAIKGQSGVQLVGVSLSLVALGGLAGLGVLWLGSRWILVAFAGVAYSSVSGFLPWYGIGMILLGGAAVLIAVHQSTGQRSFLSVLVPLTLLEPVLLFAFHQNLTQVVQVLDVCMALVLAGLGALYVVQTRAMRSDALPATARAGAGVPGAGIAPFGLNG